ncbi:uncharacterized protein LOC100680143 [Nasonia vitripennis]|uniref:N-acetyltransferase domain-containing protein n=1 Tax=Nasonia vitripennis TaxID=7425 RepID=A0A7M7HAI8_NASVI|nr:uncharacterized protein LOC100680143 [Nasonia vitripennis]XP_032454721.1 uncharacterized protein LOC100680143 [Nasonia vitripennis]XP_032454722.1 uncharacterized protein LOC100680143 [Nasonia vitripennis]
MSDKSNESRIAADWKRPAGPLNVWRQVVGRELLAGGSTRRIRFSIQDVPEDRYDEAVEHMLEFFLADEATCACLKLKQCQDAVEDFRKLWKYLFEIGLSVAAFKLDSDDSLLELAGVNVLFAVTEEINKALEDFTINFKCEKARKIFEFIHDESEKVDVCGMYGVDTYISALGLSVSPAFRGQKLGVTLLEARNDIGRKYGFTATATIFTGAASQKQAERAGFETKYSRDFSGVFDNDGQPLFPCIESKDIKFMTKELR